jgi:N-acetylglucosaminyldiphosphoundecaprenol N-acetyl-beta-D-mannosaminyltransferase
MKAHLHRLEENYGYVGMDSFFNIKLEFDQDRVDEVIRTAIKNSKTGYVCVIDGNVVSVAHRDVIYRNIVNSAIVNICDGSYLAFFYGLLRKKSVKPYIGGDLFLKLIKTRRYQHVFLGTTTAILDALKGRLQKIDPDITSSNFMPIPFMSVDEFDYTNIAREINLLGPDIIWISLGAPKQELFMHRLLPHLRKGVMVGIGAVFNFQSGIKAFRRAPNIILKMKLEWLYRLFQEPKKQWKKNKSFLKSFPNLLITEIKKN